jgi:hypothetical protein
MTRILTYAFVALCVLFTAGVFITFFERLPIEGTTLGIDNIFYELDEWDVHYSVTNGLRNPPWSVLPLVPIASLLSRKAAWGLLVFFTVAVTVLSVPRTPRRWLYLLCVLLAVASFPSLRNIADANLEGMVIAGVLLVVAGYKREHPLILAVGILLATVKPQSVSLLMLTLGVYVLQTWKPRQWLTCAGLVAAVVVPTFLWRGGDWLAALRGTYQAGSIIDIGLAAALNRTGIVPPLIVTAAVLIVLAVTLWTAWRSRRDLSREKAGMLLCGSMLIAPYVAGNSIATVLAIGIIPLFMARPLVGGILIAMVNFPFFWSAEWLYHYQSYWWTLILLLTWFILNWRIYSREVLPSDTTS